MKYKELIKAKSKKQANIIQDNEVCADVNNVTHQYRDSFDIKSNKRAIEDEEQDPQRRGSKARR